MPYCISFAGDKSPAKLMKTDDADLIFVGVKTMFSVSQDNCPSSAQGFINQWNGAVTVKLAPE
jgi:hypothetical protein